ncbi:MAG: response regulator [Thermoplasmatales archaeon]|nr:response regulator [Thermoplasmatales archaeon]
MKKKIMVVDDEPDQILTVKVALEDMDDEYEVIGAESGVQCLEILENGMIPDMILTESMMPGMTGWELLDKLKEKPRWGNIPVTFLTAWADLKTEKSRSFSVDNIIEKPFDTKDLKERIDKVLMNGSQ